MRIITRQYGTFRACIIPAVMVALAASMFTASASASDIIRTTDGSQRAVVAGGARSASQPAVATADEGFGNIPPDIYDAATGHTKNPTHTTPAKSKHHRNPRHKRGKHHA